MRQLNKEKTLSKNTISEKDSEHQTSLRISDASPLGPKDKNNHKNSRPALGKFTLKNPILEEKAVPGKT